ncbi:MAG: hypothetical protein ILP16_09995, partial [Spirochaetales bacterium]|nr:hypothetical protein [Spirochaetales bacterium]
MADNEIIVSLDEVFGTGVRSVEQTVTSEEPGGINEITVTLTNDQQNKFYVRNGMSGATGGFPVAVNSADQMTDHGTIYLYEGDEDGYEKYHLYIYNNGWKDHGRYGLPSTYVQRAESISETVLDPLGTTEAIKTGVGFYQRVDGTPTYVDFTNTLYTRPGVHEDGALTQKATSEAIEAAQFLPVVSYPDSSVEGNTLEAELEPNKLYVLNGVGYTFTFVELALTGAKADTLTRYYVRFTTGGVAVSSFDFPNSVTVPSSFSIKTQTTYDIIIENNVAHIWEDGNAVGIVLDAEATADAVADWLDDHPEATTTVADGSITTAKLAIGVIDSTLKTSGAAADAKKTGDEINDLKSQIGDLSELETEDKTDLVSAINEANQNGGSGGAGGQPTPIKLASQMTDQSAIYLYLGSETGYDYGYIYAYVDGAWTKTSLYGKGQNGYSPVANVTKSGTTAVITITDADGTTTATVTDGLATDEQVAENVTAWMDENITGGASVVVDKTLTVSGAAADSETVGIILNGDIAEEVDITANDYIVITNKSLPASGNWGTEDSGVYAIKSNDRQIKIKPQATGDGEAVIYGFLKDYSATSPTYANGCSRVILDTGSDTATLPIPDDASYFMFTLTRKSSGASRLPLIFKVARGSDSDGLINKVNEIDMVKTVLRYNPVDIDLTEENVVTGIINNSDKWNMETGEHVLIPISSNTKAIQIFNETAHSVFYTLLRSEGSTTDPEFSSDTPARVTMPAGGSVTMSTPADAKLLYITVTSTTGTDLQPSAVRFITASFSNDAEEDSDGIVETEIVPTSWGQANFIARIKQMCNIRYTLTALMPHQLGDRASGTTWTGLPYSSVRWQNKYIGIDVSIHTFMTAIHNPRSVIYTRTSPTPNSKTYYGTVCSSLVCYGWDLPIYRLGRLLIGSETDLIISDHDPNFAVCSNPHTHRVSLQQVQIGDLLQSASHSIVVVGVKKDQFGRVTKLRLAESVERNCILHDYITLTQFKQNYSQYEFWRYDKLGDADYEKSDYVIGYSDETLPDSITYPDIMCEYGDKAVIEAAQDVLINVLDTSGYSSINVYKNGTVIETKSTLADFTISNIEYGTYKV